MGIAGSFSCIWDKLKLTEAEIVYGIGSETEMDACLNNQIPLSLVGKLLTVKPFYVEAMKKTLLSIWRLQESDVIRMVETNLFVFQFFCEANKKRVMEGCPWSVADQILLLKEINNNEQPSEVNAVLILRNLENWDTVPKKDSLPGFNYFLHSEYTDIIEEVLKTLTKFASYRSISALEWSGAQIFFENVSFLGHPQLIRMKAEFALAVSIHHNPINIWASWFLYEMEDF